MPYATPTREGVAIHTVRMIGRLATMLLDLRDEYERKPRPDTLEQINRRLTELIALREELLARQANQATSAA
jgi:hypothetical protein